MNGEPTGPYEPTEAERAAYAARPVIDPIPDVDVDRVGALLLRVEADAHRRGWDHNPQLRVLFDDTADDGATDRLFRRMMGQNPNCGPATRWQGYAAQITIGPDVMARAPGAPWDHLSTFAHNIAYALPDPDPDPDSPHPVNVMRWTLTRPGVFGMAFVGVGWGLGGATHTEFEQFATGKLDAGDHPKGREARMVYAADVHNRLYVVQRDRGRKPVLSDATGHLRGSFSNNLRLLVDGLCGRAPETQVDYDERYRTLHETVSAAQHIRTCVQAALPYVDQGQDHLALTSFQSGLLKFDGDRNALAEYDPPAIAAAFPDGRAAVLAACARARLGPVG